MSDLSTPVALFVYRRPEHTERVIERILEAGPPQVLIVGDGPVDPSEEEQVNAVRRVVTGADWECEVKTNYADSNLGLKQRFTTGLDWVFNETSEAIILEDDTLPAKSFFPYCDELLETFRNDKRVWDISGRNELGRYCEGDSSYFYSVYGGIWGWATWRDSYEEYDPEMEAWDDDVVRNRVLDTFHDSSQRRYVENIFDKTYNGEIETWDYQWGFAKFRNNGVSVVPRQNLVNNIGFGGKATNTTAERAAINTPSLGELRFPIQHPNYVGPDIEYDKRYHQKRYNHGEFVRYIKRAANNIWGRIHSSS